MKKLLLILIASFYLITMCPNLAFADGSYEHGSEDPCEQAGFDDPQLCGYKEANEEKMAMERVGNILNVIYGLIGVAAVVFVIIGGVKYMTSQGDPGKVQQAKNTILFALIGLAVTISAFAITAFILKALGAGEGSGEGVSGDEVTGIIITSGKTMTEGQSMQITVTVVPDYAKDKSVTYKSSKPSIASISDTGVLYAKKAGTTTVTVTASNGVKTSVNITVKAKTSISGSVTIKLNKTNLTLEPGSTSSLEATVTPSTACSAVGWMSSDTTVVTVSTTGIIKAIKEGSATITASCSSASAKATVTVKKTSVSYSAVWEKRHYSNSNGKAYDYWINVPEGATSNMPLVIFLHGDGEMGNATKVANTKWVQNIHSATNYIGIAPVGKGFKSNNDWAGDKNMAAIKGLADTIVSEYKINTSKIYLWGFSRGSIGTWQLVEKYGSFFRAAVPVSTCGKGTSITASKFKGTKIYAVAGKIDDDVGCMTKRVNAINSAGGSAQIKVLSGVKHETMTANFPYSEIIDGWLLKQ